MLRLYSEIQIADKIFTFVNQVEITSSWDKFTDTAVITLPLKLVFDGETITGCDDAQRLFRRGDQVIIRLGYFPDLTTVFTGFVREVHNDSPMWIECEDASYLLKQNLLNFTMGAGATLTQFLDRMMEEIAAVEGLRPLPFEVTRRNPDRPIIITATKPENTADDYEGKGLRVKNVNFIQMLQQLKRQYGLVAFVRDGVLKVGLAYDAEDRNEYELSFQRNIIEDDLTFRCGGDVKIKMVVKSIVDGEKKGEIITHVVETGDPNGETKTFFLYNGEEDEDQLRDIGEAEIIKYKYDGYRGSFTTFGDPIVRHGDLVTLVDKRYPEREGRYLVDEVVTNFGMMGFRQKITLGPEN